MWAKVELDDSILEFINYEKHYNESLDEMKNLVFTKERLESKYSMTDMLNFNIIFQKIKGSALEKALNNQVLNFSEGFVFDRLLAKYKNEKIISVEDHLQYIKQNCEVNRESKRKNKNNLKKLYETFIKKVTN